MKAFDRALATTLRTAAALATVVLAGTASAAGLGSTDLWANRFADSFGGAGESGQSVRPVSDQIGSTDLWADGFRASFRPSQRGAVAKTVSLTGSTDLWGNNFRDSFALPSPSPAVEPVGLRESVDRSVR
jgi:hypothetical protein